MSNSTPHAPTLHGVPHLGRAEAVLYVLLVYLFNYIHPRYRRYIDAVAQHERLATICQRAGELDRYWNAPQNSAFTASPRTRPLWRDSDLPDIYFALLFAVRLVRPRHWANLPRATKSYDIIPSLEPG